MVDINLSDLPARTSASQVRGTRTRTSYAAEIHLRVGRRYAVVGGIQQFAQRQAQQITEEYTVRQGSRGVPEALVPQNLTTRTLQITRYDLFSDIFEKVFGLTTEFSTLYDLGSAFEIREVWNAPAPTTTGLSALGGLFTDDTQQAVNKVLTRAQGFGNFVGSLKTPETYVYLGCRFTDFGRTLRVDNRIVGVEATALWRNRKKLT